ncbi:ATP-binding protein [Nitrincola sp. MINF-07-Sa-05]|uniref:ATP-binding protein n=1 Tax=Nitrincola salilacus TaxID=3400273 RepID=UPI00391834DA
MLQRLVPRSLKARLLWGSFILLPLVVVFAVIALQRAFYESLLASEESQAQLQVYLLLGSAELMDGQLRLPDLPSESRFRQTDSGVYGFIHSQNSLLWRSPSSYLLADSLVAHLPDSQLEPGDIWFEHLWTDGFFLLQYPVVWEYDGQDRHFMVSVLRSDVAVKKQMNAFKTQLWGWLSVVFILALLVQYLIMRWGLQPLDRLARDLQSIEQGNAEYLQGEYPHEVQTVTDNLNRLIQSERQQRERYRNTLGDLAHSLKTPLAVIMGARNEELNEDEYQHLIDDQVQRMDQIVQYQLTRAVKSAHQVLARPVPLEPVAHRMAAALQKVYAEKRIQHELLIDPEAHFHGDERDLMELLGTLMENAFKYGRSQVRVSALTRDAELQIDIEDDGPGVSPEQRQMILKRGARLDSSAPGQGIGLSIAVDILSSYDGSLEVSHSELGGAAFRASLPGGAHPREH